MGQFPDSGFLVGQKYTRAQFTVMDLLDSASEAQLDADNDKINESLPPPGISVKRSSRDITFEEWDINHCTWN